MKENNKNEKRLTSIENTVLQGKVLRRMKTDPEFKKKVIVLVESKIAKK